MRKWKNEEQSDGTVKRYIRARLTVRGFKDKDANNLDTYAATSARPSQRMVCSVAAQMSWTLCTADISKAFLQGVTYDELAKLTGQPKREVAFALPLQSIPALRKVTGFEDFNPKVEVLRCFETRNWIEGCTTSIFVETSRSHQGMWFESHTARF